MVEKLFKRFFDFDLAIRFIQTGILNMMQIYNCSYIEAAKLAMASGNAFLSMLAKDSPMKTKGRITVFNIIFITPVMLPDVLKLLYRKYKNRIPTSPGYYNALAYWRLSPELRKLASEEMRKLGIQRIEDFNVKEWLANKKS